MSTREMICNLINDSVPNDELDLLYKLVLKFIPADEPEADELEALTNSFNETEFVSHDEIDWDWYKQHLANTAGGFLLPW